MPHRILIVDDDQIFNNLLTDVFKQAGYDVSSAFAADEALALLDKDSFDLIVTDQRMPGKAGTEFVREVMSRKEIVPVVMVSGFLENETIRELIRDGVGGVFIKPLNIFQLLKRAAQLIDRKEKASAASGPEDVNDTGAVSKGWLSSFPGRTQKALQFARRLKDIKDFSSTLLLVGRQGTDFERICRDLTNLGDGNDEMVVLNSANDPSTQDLLRIMSELAVQGTPRCTFVVPNSDILQEGVADTIFALSRKQPPFSDLVVQPRFVFCLTEDLDTLYDNGKIDENLYLFLGTTEVKVPPLAEVKDDIPVMAQTILDELGDGEGWKLDLAGGTFLKEKEWPGDALQLKKVVTLAAKSATGRIIGPHELADAYEGRTATGLRDAGNLRSVLEDARDQYVRAVLTLCDGDQSAAAEVLGLPEAALATVARR